MSQRLTPLQRRTFEISYNHCMEVMAKDMVDFKKELFEIMEAHNFQTQFDFGDFAREAFLHNIQKFHEHYYSLESATQSFKEIINKRP